MKVDELFHGSNHAVYAINVQIDEDSGFLQTMNEKIKSYNSKALYLNLLVESVRLAYRRTHPTWTFPNLPTNFGAGYSTYQLSSDALALRERARGCTTMKIKAKARLATSNQVKKLVEKSTGRVEDLLNKTIGIHGGWENGGAYERYDDRLLVEGVEALLRCHKKLCADVRGLDKTIKIAVAVEESEEEDEDEDEEEEEE